MIKLKDCRVKGMWHNKQKNYKKGVAMNKMELELQMQQQVETIMLILTKLLVQFDLELSINKSNGDFIFEKNDSNLEAVVGRGYMIDLYKQQKTIKG